jgi:hypothetical protein
MGPNAYVTPSGGYTQTHHDGNGTVNSGHVCLSGYNEVIMLRRLPERHKVNAMAILSPDGVNVCDLWSEPHCPSQKVRMRWATNDQIKKLDDMGCVSCSDHLASASSSQFELICASCFLQVHSYPLHFEARLPCNHRDRSSSLLPQNDG